MTLFSPTPWRGPHSWRSLLDHPLVLGLLLLAPIVFLLAPLPIDETRYLAVAWEMRQSGEFLVPHLNGATYAHKPPLLFWLINAGWLLTGVHAWTARAVTLLFSLFSLLLLYRLTLRLTASTAAARLSMWFLLGTAYFAAFANAIMFDVLLTTWVLLAVHGLVDLAEGRLRRGVLVAGAAIGLGMLTKGPVMLLDVLFIALLAPWWSADGLRGRRGRYYGAVGVVVLIGAGMILAWAIPAALHGGDAYARAIFLNQTFDRIEGVSGTSAHARPWWWYGWVFPLMLMPWPLVMRGSCSKLRVLLREPALRLAIAWMLPAFVAFSLVAGKQPHYLLPMIPALAMALALAVDRGAAQARSGVFAVALMLAGIGLAWLPRLAASRPQMVSLLDLSPAWGVALGALGVLLLLGGWRSARPLWPAAAMLLAVLLVKFSIVQGLGQRYDATAVAAHVHAAQQRGQPILSLGWHHGVYAFAGRLRQPLPVLDEQSRILEWARAHPNGLLVSFNRQYRVRAAPVFTQPFRGGDVSIWNASDAVAAGFEAAAGKPVAEDDGED